MNLSAKSTFKIMNLGKFTQLDCLHIFYNTPYSVQPFMSLLIQGLLTKNDISETTVWIFIMYD